MNILVVAGGVPYPPTWGSGMRTYQLLRHLCQRHRMTLVCHAGADDVDRVEGLKASISELQVIPSIHTLPGGLNRRLRQGLALGSALPFLAVELRSSALERAIRNAVAASDFDCIQLEGSQVASILLPIGPAVVLDEHNIEYEVLDRMRHRESSTVRRAFNTVEWLKYRAFEQRLWRSVDACAVPSERELAIVRSQASGTAAAAVPNAVDPGYFKPEPTAVKADSLVFTGLLSYRPNFDAARYLVDEVFPLVARERPRATLTIVGDGDPAHFEALRRPGVTITGRVDDVRPYVQQAAVCVAPLRMGGGTRLKVLEALAMAKPLVSTRLGSEGIAARHGEHLVIADDEPLQYGHAILDLLSNPEAAAVLGWRGRRLIETKYTWAQVSTCFDDLYIQACNAGRTKGAA
ncbi:MAG: glycosyltransferase [Acidimicrobiales bacterium]